MEKLQPPSVSRILMDPNLANQSRADLSLMVENIAEAMSCKAAMRMAFRFIQDGLHTLNMALQDVLLTEVTPAPSKYVKLPPIARDEQKSIIHLPQILAKAERIIRSGLGSGTAPPSHQGTCTSSPPGPNASSLPTACPDSSGYLDPRAGQLHRD
ncbi:hypothetical protein DPEC_G00361450 [Dallia pectoralis]|nr:hypothetical protein DPEC_G00361450 [Dallia pectoralis]